MKSEYPPLMAQVQACCIISDSMNAFTSYLKFNDEDSIYELESVIFKQ